MAKPSILDRIESGERARLIPVTSSRQKELAAVSVVLAVFRIVPEFAKAMSVSCPANTVANSPRLFAPGCVPPPRHSLGYDSSARLARHKNPLATSSTYLRDRTLKEVGAPTSKRSRLTAMSEICFKKPKHTRATLPRPDGLLAVDTGHREWVALVEAKIKHESLKVEQLEKYLDLAREAGADALITISNQFATVSSHHPVRVDQKKTRNIGLYHFSWLSLLSNAQLLSESESVKDREQAIVLKELIRFLARLIHDLAVARDRQVVQQRAFATERTGGVLACTVRIRDRAKGRCCAGWRFHSRLGHE